MGSALKFGFEEPSLVQTYNYNNSPTSVKVVTEPYGKDVNIF
jgi:hypothetical protein